MQEIDYTLDIVFGIGICVSCRHRRVVGGPCDDGLTCPNCDGRYAYADDVEDTACGRECPVRHRKCEYFSPK
jgi:hypothetical protein